MFDETEEMGWMGKMNGLVRQRDLAKKRRIYTDDLEPLFSGCDVWHGGGERDCWGSSVYESAAFCDCAAAGDTRVVRFDETCLAVGRRCAGCRVFGFGPGPWGVRQAFGPVEFQRSNVRRVGGSKRCASSAVGWRAGFYEVE
jgi:hypothetical protein